MPKKVRTVPDDMRDIGARIVEWRRELGFNQAELAARAAVDATVLNRVEKRGLLDPTASFVLRVARALSRTADELLTGRSPVTILSEPNVPRDLVREITAQVTANVVRLIPLGGEHLPKPPGAGRKLRGSKRNAQKS